MQQHVRTGGDIISASGLVATLMGYLPAIAAALTILWTAMRIVEMFTGKPFHESRIARFVVRLVRKVLPERKD